MEQSKAEARKNLQSLYQLYGHDFDRVQKDMLQFFERMKREKERGADLQLKKPQEKKIKR